MLLTKLKHKLLMRAYDLILGFISLPRPMVLAGKGSSLRLCRLFRAHGVRKVLVVTDKDLVAIGLHQRCVDVMHQSGLQTVVFDDVTANPTIAQMESGLALARESGCDAILGLGGGSPLDAAKIIAAGLSNDMSIAKMEGAFKLRKPLLPLFAIPTTAGTGSEVTFAAVVSDPHTRRKYTVADPKLIPLAVALDAELMVGLPPHVTAATGMDALTHAVESYICTRAHDGTRKNARMAVELIFENLQQAYDHGDDLEARECMALAACFAGEAFADVGVGYVHALAHQFGGLYGVPHGLANAVLLPHIIAVHQDVVRDRLAELAISAGLRQGDESNERLARRFVSAIAELSKAINIPERLEAIDLDDIPIIVQRAQAEAMQLFAVPEYLSAEQLATVVRSVATKSAVAA